jgi:hypothetical protein
VRLPTGQARGILEDNAVLVCSGEREAPRDKPVASWKIMRFWFVAANVKLHGTSPWHLGR